jgi:hypothetical protein
MSNTKKESAQEHLVLDIDGEITSMSHKEISTVLYDVSINEIKNLDEKLGKILTMKLIDNMKIREISEKLNMNESTVKNHLYKGKSLIYDIITTNYKDLCEQYFESYNEETKNEF